MGYLPIESWIEKLPHDKIVEIWNQTKLKDYIGSPKGRPRINLARDIVAFFECETLAQASIREALLYAYEKPGIKPCSRHPSVTRRGNWA